MKTILPVNGMKRPPHILSGGGVAEVEVLFITSRFSALPVRHDRYRMYGIGDGVDEEHVDAYCCPFG